MDSDMEESLLAAQLLQIEDMPLAHFDESWDIDEEHTDMKTLVGEEAGEYMEYPRHEGALLKPGLQPQFDIKERPVNPFVQQLKRVEEWDSASDSDGDWDFGEEEQGERYEYPRSPEDDQWEPEAGDELDSEEDGYAVGGAYPTEGSSAGDAGSKAPFAWHTKNATHKALLNFHSSTTRYPKEAIREAQDTLEYHLHEITKYLKRKGFCLRLEFTGSVYEGVKVDTSPLEFDIMVVLAGCENCRAVPLRGHKAYVTLEMPKAKSKAAKERKTKNVTQKETFLHPGRVVSDLHRYLDRYLQENPGNAKQVIYPRIHGPALQLDFRRPGGSRERWFSVDMVPTVEAAEKGKTRKHLYVAKPLQTVSPHSWRLSTSLEEKLIMQKIDQGNCCRKQCLRILKAIRDREPPLQYLNSFVLKSLILQHRQEGDWSQAHLGKQVLNMLGHLMRGLQKGFIPHFKFPGINLLDSVTPDSRKPAAKRLEELLRSEVKFLKAIGARS